MRSNHVCPGHQVQTPKQNLCLLLGPRVLSHLPGPRSRTVCNISALPPEVRELVAAALGGQTCLVLEQIELSQALDYGGLAVLRDAWQRFGLEKLFAEVPQACLQHLKNVSDFKLATYESAKTLWHYILARSSG